MVRAIRAVMVQFYDPRASAAEVPRSFAWNLRRLDRSKKRVRAVTLQPRWFRFRRLRSFTLSTQSTSKKYRQRAKAAPSPSPQISMVSSGKNHEYSEG